VAGDGGIYLKSFFGRAHPISLQPDRIVLFFLGFLGPGGPVPNRQEFLILPACRLACRLGPNPGGPTLFFKAKILQPEV